VRKLVTGLGLGLWVLGERYLGAMAKVGIGCRYMDRMLVTGYSNLELLGCRYMDRMTVTGYSNPEPC
jgi:hypothetical protein